MVPCSPTQYLSFIRKQSFHFTENSSSLFLPDSLSSEDVKSLPKILTVDFATSRRIVFIKLDDELQSFHLSFVCIHLSRPVQHIKFPGHFLKPARLRKKQIYQLNIIGLKIPTGGRQTSLFTSMTDELN